MSSTGPLRPTLWAASPPAHHQSELASKQAEVDGLTRRINDGEARTQGGAAARREEYVRLEKAVGALRRSKNSLRQDLDIATMDPKEVRRSGAGGRGSQSSAGGRGEGGKALSLGWPASWGYLRHAGGERKRPWWPFARLGVARC